MPVNPSRDRVMFQCITFERIGEIKRLHPLVYDYYSDHLSNRIDHLADCPDIMQSFPFVHYLTIENRIVSTCLAIPDKVSAYGNTYPWAWAGALMTDPNYRGMGLATRLITEMAAVLNGRGIAWGGVFSTQRALRIYKKLNFIIPGVANRYLFAKTAVPLTSLFYKENLCVSLFDNIYRGFAKFFMSLVYKRKAAEMIEVVEHGPGGYTNAFVRRDGMAETASFYFNSSSAKMNWKVSSTHNNVVHLIKDKAHNRVVGHIIVNEHTNTRRIRNMCPTFTVMTIMDYCMYDDADDYHTLMTAVFTLFRKSKSDVLEIISSSHGLNRFLARKGMLLMGGMSFTFKVPEEWRWDNECTKLNNWRLTHFDGDAYSFY